MNTDDDGESMMGWDQKGVIKTQFVSHGKEFKCSKCNGNLLQENEIIYLRKQENEIIYFKKNPKGKETTLNVMCPEN